MIIAYEYLTKSHNSLQVTLKSYLYLYVTELAAILHLVFKFKGKKVSVLQLEMSPADFACILKVI